MENGRLFRSGICLAVGDIMRPRQNRVSPTGEIAAVSARGLFMGNRGDLHAPDGSYGGKLSARDAWISCLLIHQSGRKITFERPGRYYPLFFLDEAVAMAVGHRPCGECRAEMLDEFKGAWKRALGLPASRFVSARQMDEVLRQPPTAQVEFDLSAMPVAQLPDGTFVDVEGHGACLFWGGSLLPWHWHGYESPILFSKSARHRVLTPASMVRVLANGYRPVVHHSVVSWCTALKAGNDLLA